MEARATNSASLSAFMLCLTEAHRAPEVHEDSMLFGKPPDHPFVFPLRTRFQTNGAIAVTIPAEAHSGLTQEVSELLGARLWLQLRLERLLKLRLDI